MKKINLKNSLLASIPLIEKGDTETKVNIIDYNTKVNVLEIILNAITWILGFAGALAALAIIYSGLLYITASSNPERQQNAKKALTHAVMGIIIVVLAYIVILLIGNVLNTVAN